MGGLPPPHWDVYEVEPLPPIRHCAHCSKPGANAAPRRLNCRAQEGVGLEVAQQIRAALLEGEIRMP
jgi:hypothetical protein